MAVFKLLESDNSVLKVKLEDCNPELNRQELKDNLIETMQHYEGIGLSANQVGVMERAFVMYNHVETKQIIAVFNPKIIKEGDEKVLIQEGCLSFPGLWVKVNRSETIEVEYEDEKGEKMNDLTEKLRKKTEENLAKNKEYQQLIS
jgi:peptide deformylase